MRIVPLDVPNIDNGSALADFVNLAAGNLLKSGMARFHFGLTRENLVEVHVLDVSGRVIRILANRTFKAGEHDLVWDGTDDGGRPMAPGVYFAQVRFRNSGFAQAKKVIVLK